MEEVFEEDMNRITLFIPSEKTILFRLLALLSIIAAK
jgi:hypothetical protein